METQFRHGDIVELEKDKPFVLVSGHIYESFLPVYGVPYTVDNYTAYVRGKGFYLTLVELKHPEIDIDFAESSFKLVARGGPVKDLIAELWKK